MTLEDETGDAADEPTALVTADRVMSGEVLTFDMCASNASRSSGPWR